MTDHIPSDDAADRAEINPAARGEASPQRDKDDETTDVDAPPPPPTAKGMPVDGLALWDAEAVAGPAAGLATLRVDQNERPVIPFTTDMVRIDLHYVDFQALRGYVRCNGPSCLLCRVGRQPEMRDLLPVYDVLDKAVAVLVISPNLRPHALRPQLAPALRRLADGGPLLVTLRKDGNGKFLVTSLPLPEGAADGAAVIRAFCERFDADLVDLASPFQRLADEDLASVEEIRSLMAAKGIAR